MLSRASETKPDCDAVGQHSGNSKPGNEAAQKSLDRRAAHLILRGARELLTTRATDLKAQAAQFHQVLGANPGPGAVGGHSPNSTQKMTPVSLPPLPSPLTSPTATPVILPKEVRNAARLAWHVLVATCHSEHVGCQADTVAWFERNECISEWLSLAHLLTDHGSFMNTLTQCHSDGRSEVKQKPAVMCISQPCRHETIRHQACSKVLLHRHAVRVQRAVAFLLITDVIISYIMFAE